MTEENTQKESISPSDDILLNHLYPLHVPEVIVGYWEPGKKYLIDIHRQKKVFIIDEIGEFIWSLCDGEHSVREMEKKLVKEAEQDKENVRTSLATFLMKLKKKGYITLEEKKS